MLGNHPGPVVCGAKNMDQNSMDFVFERLKPKSIERVAGAGNKFLHLASGKSDLYMNFVPGLKYWDTCAGDAIIKSRFGIFNDASGK